MKNKEFLPLKKKSLIGTVLGALVMTSSMGLMAAQRSHLNQGGPMIGQKNKSLRLQNAKEIMGNQYNKSSVKIGEKLKGFEPTLTEAIEAYVPKHLSQHSKRMARAILASAKKFHFDPTFIAAVIRTESSFNPTMIGGVGEVGLMQIRPEHAEWIARKTKVKWKGEAALKTIEYNIMLGTAYMAYLREKHKRDSDLYIAAYNMGSANVRRLIAQETRPSVYPSKVRENYQAFYKEMGTLQTITSLFEFELQPKSKLALQ